jgi:ApbE superfamily uncharacterized protein (UPF0280 family)
MSEMQSTHDVKEELRAARANLRNHIAELDHQIHTDVPARVSDNAPLIAAGAATLGALIGFGGRKAVKGLLAAGAVAAAGAMFLKSRR